MSADTPTKSALYAALAAAQERCKAVAKDATNKFHNYKYASAEAIYTEARRALDGTGLSLVPTVSRQEMREGVLPPPADPSQKVPQVWLVREFRLAHTSGEAEVLKIEWPVVMDRKGQTLDKAVAGAETSSLAYLYRDLLSMPRVDASDDLNFGRRGREDDVDAEARAAEEFERQQAAKPKGKPRQQTPTHNSQSPPSTSGPLAGQQGGGGSVPVKGVAVPEAPSKTQPTAAPSAGKGDAVEVAAKILGPAARQAIGRRPTDVLELDHEDALMAEIVALIPVDHPLVNAFIDRFSPAAQVREAGATVEQWRGLIGSLRADLEKVVKK